MSGKHYKFLGYPAASWCFPGMATALLLSLPKYEIHLNRKQATFHCQTQI